VIPEPARLTLMLSAPIKAPAATDLLERQRLWVASDSTLNKDIGASSYWDEQSQS
jgi:hypothetical protein